MRILLPILCLIVAVSCQKTPPPSETVESTSTPTTPDTLRVSIPAPSRDQIAFVQSGDSVILNFGGKNILSFTPPEGSEVTTGQYGSVVAEWEPKDLITHKSFVFQFNDGYCNTPGDEGTSTEFIDTLAHGPGFAHGRFDNLVAGAEGIDELYYVRYDGYCVTFWWNLGMASYATPDDRQKEIAKMEEFLKTVNFL